MPAKDKGSGIEQAAAMLIAFGHVNVFDYGWSFFMEALNSLETVHEMMSSVVARGIAMCFQESKRGKNG